MIVLFIIKSLRTHLDTFKNWNCSRLGCKNKHSHVNSLLLHINKSHDGNARPGSENTVQQTPCSTVKSKRFVVYLIYIYAL